MSELNLYPMKEIKIIVEGNQAHFITAVLDKIKASGYTVFNNLSGKGDHGYIKEHLLYNDTSSLQMILTVIPKEKLEPILAGIKPIIERYSVNLFVTLQQYLILSAKRWRRHPPHIHLFLKVSQPVVSLGSLL